MCWKLVPSRLSTNWLSFTTLFMQNKLTPVICMNLDYTIVTRMMFFLSRKFSSLISPTYKTVNVHCEELIYTRNKDHLV